MKAELAQIGRETDQAVRELLKLAHIQKGQLLVIGCSTSEVMGQHIGSAGSAEVAAVILQQVLAACREWGVYVAIQCCEHLNRALVVEAAAAEAYQLEPVCVRPVAKAGGSLAACAMENFSQPVVVEALKAHAGLDIGCTLIGMHLKTVAVPVRLQQKNIGQALLIAARTRPKLIGGARAVYEIDK